MGGRLHTGRSRNEQVSLDLRLYLRRRIPLLQLTADLRAGWQELRSRQWAVEFDDSALEDPERLAEEVCEAALVRL